MLGKEENGRAMATCQGAVVMIRTCRDRQCTRNDRNFRLPKVNAEIDDDGKKDDGCHGVRHKGSQC